MGFILPWGSVSFLDFGQFLEVCQLLSPINSKASAKRANQNCSRAEGKEKEGNLKKISIDMNSKQSSIWPVGQRSIASTFLFRASNRSENCKKNVEIKTPTQNGSRTSLSDFLNRKLHRSSVLPVHGKELPFLSPSSVEDLNKCAVGKGEVEAKFSFDNVFKMFRNLEKNEKNCINSSATTSSFDVDDLQQTKKRKNQLQGHDYKPSARKVLAVLGDDSKPKQSRKSKNFAHKEESKPLFNHYENGGGWWDDNMEGVDNEEVGCSDVWEGMGCTTLGGIEWH